ncbi:hypothetical protein B0T22DRAFT_492097 [Podospora appendiculata]|uniref:Uncharacterized protein n=1 Tax=Podospora appendiculata TaxID=314037 RepID=A0AAE0X4L9_9PEZI|nr:hypothetical protein B0T22DRAFT_492097 [Podospora appendiculata]
MIPHSVANPLGHGRASFRQISHDTVTAAESFTAAVGGAPPIFSTTDLDPATNPLFITISSSNSPPSPSIITISESTSSGNLLPSIISHLPPPSSTTRSTDAATSTEASISSQRPLQSLTSTSTSTSATTALTQTPPPQSPQPPPSTPNDITPGMTDQRGYQQNTCLGAAALVAGTVLSGIAFFVVLLYASYALSRWWGRARHRGKRLEDSSVEMCELERPPARAVVRGLTA